MLEKEKDHVGKAKWVNWDGRRKTTGAIDAHYSQVGYGNEGWNDYRDNWGC